MRLLGGEDMTVAKYHSYDKYGIECGKEPMQKPNYFWYVCPEGIISEAECPKFAGLMYITDSGAFRCIKTAPCLHKTKYETQTNLLRRNMQDKFYYAMWNWIRRYWRNIGKAKDIAPQTAAAYERALYKQAEKISDLKYRISSLIQWRNPKKDLPKENTNVIIRYSADKEGICTGRYNANKERWELNDMYLCHLSTRVPIHVVAWRDIHE